MNDDDLMVRTARGDGEAFRLLVERWEKAVFAFHERMVGSAEDALDLSQETFLRVYDQARKYRPSGQFRSWLFRIAGNLARSWLRRKRIVRWLRFEPERHDRSSSSIPADRLLEMDETERAVRQALARLPDRQRQAILLRRYDNLSHQEIATALRTTVPAVESLLQRAMGALRKDLSRRGI